MSLQFVFGNSGGNATRNGAPSAVFYRKTMRFPRFFA